MVIREYELFEVPPRWLFLKIETDDGTVGWGEPIVEGRAKTVRTAVQELMDNYLVGKDPGRIEDHWQTMYRGGFYRGGPVLMSALAGIDQALWDLKGKRFGAPVYELLGGAVRDRVRVYQGIGNGTPQELSERASDAVDDGFSVLKMGPLRETEHVESLATIDRVCDRLAAVREAVGAEVDVALDFHGRASKSLAKQLVSAIEPYEPMFVEEPVLPEHSDAILELARRTSIPIATGERLFSRWDFKSLLESGAVDVIQPDLSHAGGITEVKKLAAQAEAYDVAVAPHCPLGPIAFAASLQIDACCHNAFVQEQSLDIHYHADDDDALDYLADPGLFDFEGGFVELPDGPGLGVDIDETTVRERAGDVDWHNPVWRTDDGSITEW
ncbi:galactonate dehydratase [Halomontanus rarus]|uniref:galactonate dehydratase n=1 Tax=Halomontanus rarus TaxID=3034020 RepID=UPI0023E8BB27|nr:galactonate dehydratase [Halovivax sp. TS33]